MDLAIEIALGALLTASALGVVVARRPVYAALSFLVTLLVLATLYLTLHAQFISVMQVLVYAGAILVLFMFVIMLFQDAHLEIHRFPAVCSKGFLLLCGVAFAVALAFLGWKLWDIPPSAAARPLPEDFGTVQALGRALYTDFFFPFEAVILLFLVAVVGAVYVGRKER